MSRKTRKLMWSAPLVAVFAVAGALAMFVMLAPNGAQAHEPGANSAPHQPPNPVTGIDVFTPTIDNGGRTSLQVSWNAPTDGDAPTMYRVDLSTDTDVWHNVIGGEESDKDTLTDDMAMSNCTTDDEGNRCYTVTGLMAGTQYHFRVFGMNYFGTSGISVLETIASGTTLPVDPPAKAVGLEATDYFTDKIVVSWDKVEMTGGADVLWYCLGVASSPNGPFTDLASTTDAAAMAACLNATTSVGVTDDGIVALLQIDVNGSPPDYASQTAVIPAMKPVLDANDEPVEDADGNVVMEDNLSYTHGNIGGGDHDGDADDASGMSADLPDEIELRYRLYAVTDVDGKASTPGDRRIARAASEVALGSTIRPPEKPTEQAETPGRIGGVRVLAYTDDLDDDDSDGGTATPTPEVLHGLWDDDDGDPLTALTRAPNFDQVQELHFYWNHPANYKADPDSDAATAHPWRIEVQRRVPQAKDHKDFTDWQFVDGTGQISTPSDLLTNNTPTITTPVTGYGVPQFSVNFTPAETDPATSSFEAPTLWGDNASSRVYRVRYVNPGVDEMYDTDDDVEGAWNEFTIPLVTTDYFLTDADLIPAFDTANTPTTTLPIVRISAATLNGSTDPGLKFEHLDGRIGRDHIKLVWDRNVNGRATTKQPNGYVIDRSADGGMTWHRLARADSPLDLGTADTFTDVPGGDHKVLDGATYQYRVFPVFINTGADAYGAPALVDAASRGADRPMGVGGLTVTADGQHAFDLSWQGPSDDGGHEVKGYLIQWAPDRNNNPGTTWTDAPVEKGSADPLTTRVTKNADGTVKDDGTTYKFNPMIGTAPNQTPVLTPGVVRWFRVIPVTDENDGNQATGGTNVNIETGVIITSTPDIDADDLAAPANLPHGDDATRAVPVKEATDSLGDAAADTMVTPPAAPVDLTAEPASDTNALGDGDRGVFLTWNEVEEPDTDTVSYRISRIRMNTGVDALNSKDGDDDDTDVDYQFLRSVSDVTSWTDATPLRQDEETRMYQVCSVATGVADPVCVEMPATYALHPDMHMPSMPQMVTAAADSTTAITVSWATPADDGGSAITGFTVRWKQSDATSYAAANMATADATASSHMVTGLMAGTSYTFQVRATNAEGDSYWSMYAMAMTDAAVTELMAPAITITTIDDADPGALDVMVTWTAGANADGQLVMLFTDDFAGDPVVATKSATDTMHTFTDVANGDYVVVVVSYTNDVNFQFDFTSVSVAGGS